MELRNIFNCDLFSELKILLCLLSQILSWALENREHPLTSVPLGPLTLLETNNEHLMSEHCADYTAMFGKRT